MTNTNNRNLVVEAREKGSLLNHLNFKEILVILRDYNPERNRIEHNAITLCSDDEMIIRTDGTVIMGLEKRNGLYFTYNKRYNLPYIQGATVEAREFIKQKIYEKLQEPQKAKMIAVRNVIKYYDDLKVKYAKELKELTDNKYKNISSANKEIAVDKQNNKEKKETRTMNTKGNTNMRIIAKKELATVKLMSLAHTMRRAANLDMPYREQMSMFLKYEWRLCKASGDITDLIAEIGLTVEQIGISDLVTLIPARPEQSTPVMPKDEACPDILDESEDNKDDNQVVEEKKPEMPTDEEKQTSKETYFIMESKNKLAFNMIRNGASSYFCPFKGEHPEGYIAQKTVEFLLGGYKQNSLPSNSVYVFPDCIFKRVMASMKLKVVMKNHNISFKKLEDFNVQSLLA